MNKELIQRSRKDRLSQLLSSESCESTPYLSIPAFQKTSCLAAISTRMGGVSQNPYQHLNLAYHVGDPRESVTENRRRFCQALGIDLWNLVAAHQVHGDRIAVIESSHAGCGAYGHENAIPDTDAMITKSPSVALAVLTADCVPVLIVDPVRKAVGVAHAGWKGTLLMIAAKSILKMRDAFGTEPSDCLVALGPSIGPCCYNVGEDLLSRFREKFGPEVCAEENKLDLQRAVEIQLVDVGVEEDKISSEGLCTACNLDVFYSYRAEGGRTGRIMSAIKLI